MKYIVYKNNKEIGTVYGGSLFMANRKAKKLYGDNIKVVEK